jgi:DNA-directed RNA polymerase specialized sigma24 family protein
MARVVVLPQNYEELSPTERSAIVPICIAAFDRQGQPIPPEWFSKGVEPVREHLVNIARHILGDPWCVSELAEVTVHRLWEKHQIVVHPSPARLVLKTAMWVAEELKNGGSRQMRYQHLDLPLDALDLKIREKTLVDPTNYADLFERQILLDWVEDRLRIEGRTEIRTVYQLVRHGHTWQEIAERVGAADLESVKRRFYRCIKKAANRHADLYQVRLRVQRHRQRQQWPPKIFLAHRVPKSLCQSFST